ncbi:MAG: 5'/3'-nucleotidase SurE [Rickettsiaceae bacterium H1]|nr:5'/3'-nucleotidase SurE [Rickettsiaceae bacterium H1]
MKVLLTNDDGINAPGLRNLFNTVSKYDFVKEVWTIAPDVNRSCSSHSMSFNKRITVNKLAEKKFAVTGTPVDCVIFAIKDLMKESRPDMVISGINEGANVDIDIMYSGTVAAAREASLSGIPGIAISQIYRGHRSSAKVKWQHENKIFIKILADLISSYDDKNLFKERSLLNINLPFVDVIGVKVLSQGNHYLGNHIEAVNKGEYLIGTNNIKIDCPSLHEGYIVINPVGIDLTDYGLLDYLANNKITKG